MQVLKEYICLAHGQVENCEIKDRIKVQRETNAAGKASSVACVSNEGRPAFTEVDVLGRYTSTQGDFYSLLKCRIHTGRTHQIRVHLKHRGFPLVSDIKYASELYDQDKLFCTRNFLHNSRLAVDDIPEDGESVRRILDAPLPVDLREALRTLTPQDDASECMMNRLHTTGLI